MLINAVIQLYMPFIITYTFILSLLNEDNNRQNTKKHTFYVNTLFEKIYIYFQLENKQLRYSKIRKFLYNLEDNQFNSYNLSSMKVIKDSNFLIFLINK